MNTTRRSILKTTAWTTPAVMVATAAPAFATSDPTPPPVECEPVGCKRPGKPRRKSYYLTPGCDSQVLAVHIDGRRAELTDHGWAIHDQGDSRHALPVVITTSAGTWAGAVAFPPCQGGAHR